MGHKQSALGVLPGFIDWFAGATAPSGWVVCNGATVSRTAYAALFAAIGTTYGAGDGATTFSIPDLRDDFIRGSSGSRAVGSRASDTIRSHDHTGASWQQTAPGNDQLYGNQGGVLGWPTYSSVAAQTSATGGEETAPRHVVMLPCIKY